jgi:hypothetical protein
MTTRIQPIPPIYFAAPRNHGRPWPFSPVLDLPGGALHNFACGKILSAQHFVVMVGLSPQHFIAVERAPGLVNVQPSLEQAVGFLWGLGAKIERIRLRCPIFWFTNNQGDFNWRDCFVFFVRSYLAMDPTAPPWMPSIVYPVVPLGAVARTGQAHWESVEQILTGVEATDPYLLLALGSSLAGMARRWEYYVARLLILAHKAGVYRPSDRDSLAQCDQTFYRLLTKFEPGYELLPVTIMRLL